MHLPEFKAEVGREAVRGVMTINEIGQAHKASGFSPLFTEHGKPGLAFRARGMFILLSQCHCFPVMGNKFNLKFFPQKPEFPQ